MLHPDPIFTYDLACQRQHDLASEAEWARLARMARTSVANRQRRSTRGRLAAAWQRLTQSLAHAPVPVGRVREVRPAQVRSGIAHS